MQYAAGSAAKWLRRRVPSPSWAVEQQRSSRGAPMNPSPFSPFSSTTVNAQAGYYARPIDLSSVMRQVYLWLAMGLAIGFGIAFAIGHEVQRELDTASSISDLRLTVSLFNP